MYWKLEVVVVPVADIDRAKAFYVDKLGFGLDHDFTPGARAAPGAAENSRPTPRDPAASLSGRRSVVQDRLARLLRAAG